MKESMTIRVGSHFILGEKSYYPDIYIVSPAEGAQMLAQGATEMTAPPIETPTETPTEGTTKTARIKGSGE